MNVEHTAENEAPVCGAWNDAHDCHLPADHPGDHICAGCRDRWNRGPWDDDDPDEWSHERPDPEDRCVIPSGETRPSGGDQS